MVAIVTVTGSGQITIPAEMRRSLNIERGDRVMVTETESGQIVVKPVMRTVDELCGIFPLKPGVRTTGDFDDLIHEAFEEGYARQVEESRDRTGDQ